jgi:glycosyltransferase involved in cell wall biosynthesis
LPYKDYIKANSSAHILLDQIYSYDQGYNALEAMAKGKVVFTGAESCFYEHYNLKEQVCINAKPNVNYLVEKLSDLIENPSKIETISRNAKLFVSKYHNLETVSKQYLEIYNSTED